MKNEEFCVDKSQTRAKLSLIFFNIKYFQLLTYLQFTSPNRVCDKLSLSHPRTAYEFIYLSLHPGTKRGNWSIKASTKKFPHFLFLVSCFTIHYLFSYNINVHGLCCNNSSLSINLLLFFFTLFLFQRPIYGIEVDKMWKLMDLKTLWMHVNPARKFIVWEVNLV